MNWLIKQIDEKITLDYEKKEFYSWNGAVIIRNESSYQSGTFFI